MFNISNNNWFCFFGSGESELPPDCSLAFITISFHVFFILLTLGFIGLVFKLICNYNNQLEGKKTKAAKNNRRRYYNVQQSSNTPPTNEFQASSFFLPHHVSLWIFTFILFTIILMKCSEEIILFYSVPQTQLTINNDEKVHSNYIYWIRLFNPICSLVSLSCVTELFYLVEKKWKYYSINKFHNKSKYLLLGLWWNIIYFIGRIGLVSLKLRSGTEVGTEHYDGWSMDSVKLWSEVGDGISSSVLCILLLHGFWTASLKSKNFKPKKIKGPSIQDIKYRYKYSVLPSRLTFYWFTKLLLAGYKEPLEEEDLGLLPAEEKTNYQFNRFHKIYSIQKEQFGGQFSLWKVMFSTLWSSLIVGGVFRLFADFFSYIPPIGIRTIVQYTRLSYPNIPNNATIMSSAVTTPLMNIQSQFVPTLSLGTWISNGYVMLVVILLSGILQSTFSQCSTFIVNSEGIHLKIALQALIYKKSLTLSPTKSSKNTLQMINHETSQNATPKKQAQDSLSSSSPVRPPPESDTEDKNNKINSEQQNHEDGMRSSASGFDNGSIVNIMSEDTNNIMMFFWMAHFIWAIPLKLSILMVLLYYQLGYSALIGAGICILLMIPLQFWVGKQMSLNSKGLMEKCDDRLRSISEILQGIKLLKVHGWELIFSKNLKTIRNTELKHLDRDLLLRSIMTFLTHISSILVTLITFGLYPWIETTRLEPPQVFAGLALFNQLTVPLFIFPITVPIVIDALVSTRRVREFLLLPEVTAYTKSSQEESFSSSPSPSMERAAKNDGKLSKDEQTEGISTTTTTLSLPKSKICELDVSTDSVFSPIPEGEEDQEEDDDGFEQEVGICERSKFLFPNNISPIIDQSVINHEKFMSEKLSSTDLKDNVVEQDLPDSTVLKITDGEFSWEEDRADSSLSGINLDLPKGKLTIIVGSIGSGKSSLVSGILGEMKLWNGTVEWKKDTQFAYASQKPWIQNGSVRENILFGQPYKPKRYKKIIEACGLGPDIEILPGKDWTEIGEKGINLSGGQRQRIAISRALYNTNANVIILDDPLSALDVEVAHSVFNNGIKKLLKGKSVILVTHHLPSLPDADHIIAMERGKIRIQGTLSEIKIHDPTLYAQWKEIMTKKEAEIDSKVKLKTAKERWQLFKLVTKFGLQSKQPPANIGDGNTPGESSGSRWKLEPDAVQPSNFDSHRKRLATFSTFRHLSHDVFLQSDDCHDEILTPLLRRRTVSRQSRLSRDSRTSASSNSKGQGTSTTKAPGHSKLLRMTSLQVDTMVGGSGTRKQLFPVKVKRLQSLPATDESGLGEEEGVPCVGTEEKVQRERAGTMEPSMVRPQNIFKRLLSVTGAGTRRTLSSTGSSGTELDQFQRLTSTTSGVSESDAPEDDGDDLEYELLAREQSFGSGEREYGKIPLGVYLSYIRACGVTLSIVYLLFLIGYEGVRVYTNFWLKEWSDSVSRSKSTEDYDDLMTYYFQVYVILSIVTVLVSLSTNLIGKQGGANSREFLHNQMLDRIIRAPVHFFESTPIGRIINRFSSDVAVVDRKLCISLQRFLQFVFLCLSAIIVNAIVNPWFLIVAVPIIGIYYFLQRFYRFSSRELQRIEAISRGPIYSHFHETLEGLSIIRSFREEARFTEQMLEKIDLNNTASMFINVGNRWLSISLDYLGSIIVFLATLVAMISSYLYPEVVTPSMVGLAINYTLLVPVYLNWVVKFLAEVEMFMNSVDRIDRYSQVPIEDYGESITDTELTATKEELDKKWPCSGEIQFNSLSVQYGLGPGRPQIIKNLNLTILPEQKVGICGRSGSGKSSLLMSLFRVSEISSGSIFIDGRDICSIPLLKLRSSLSIIPQENILFSGTLRFNLDPFGTCSDEEIWKTLALVQMKDVVSEIPGQLDGDIKDGGSFFSGGQKQLLGLARAILHKSKVVILDEATSSVDFSTERTILQVVNQEFKNSTVLSIAHRLDTISDGDRVIVLDAGVVVEDGNPTDLLRKPHSIFKSIKHVTEQGHLH